MAAKVVERFGASTKAIQHHYDVGDDFFRLWLDPTCTYSCALWNEGDDLETAQLRKLDYHIYQAQASGAKHVLDIGCGWGSMLKRLVDVHHVEQATGLTLSQSQAQYIMALNHPRIEVRLESWEKHVPYSPYDSIISIGAFEHFAKLNISDTERMEAYRLFFQRCHQWLKPGGYFSLQTIIYENSDREDFSAFFEQEIFPESDLPKLSEIVKATERLFEIVNFRNDRKDYERTVKVWLQRLRQNRTEAVKRVGEQVVARYEKY